MAVIAAWLLSLLGAPPVSTRTVHMRFRDGTSATADVTRPNGRGPFPVLLERTPFGRATLHPRAVQWAQRGYAYVAQDCRGRGDSGGTWDPFVTEGADGFDAVAWCARQAWSSGGVVLVGEGYDATAAWLAAGQRPSALRGLVSLFPFPGPTSGFPYENGTFRLADALAWTRGPGAPLVKSYDVLPLSHLDRRNSVFQRWLSRSSPDDWPTADLATAAGLTQVPCLCVSGWSDPEEVGTLTAWEALRRAGRRDAWLVMGPWTRPSDATSDPKGTDLDALIGRFCESAIQGRAEGMSQVPMAQTYIAGADRWWSGDGWPSRQSALQTFYLGPNSLRPQPGEAGASAYTYDPERDTGSADPPAGTYAVFAGEPTTEAMTIGGPFEVRLFYKSSAVTTDLYAQLFDLAPGGGRRPIGKAGKLRASLVPGRVTTALLRPWDDAYEMPKGHRLALLVTSTAFPRFARNMGTGEPLRTAEKAQKQRNVILTGIVTPSRITFRRLG